LLEPTAIEGSTEGPGLYGTEDWAALDRISEDAPGDSEGSSAGPPAAPEPPKTYRVQVGAFEKRLDADLLVSSLRGGGYAAAVVERQLPSGKVVFRVIVGPYATREAAKEAAAQLHGLGHTDAWVPVSEG
jgi:cell division septation protein DedD